jgi:nucleoside-diphosphate-sugar epimerase
VDRDDIIVVTGAGGFIGGHLVASLRKQGFRHIRAVDCKPAEQWHQFFSDVDDRLLDLTGLDACRQAAKGATYIFNLGG